MSTYATHSHIVPVAHPVFFILRIAQLVLAVALLGLLAYLAYVYNNVVGSVTTVYSGAIGVGLFSTCLTIILGVYYLVSTTAVHKLYNKWVVVALEAAAAVFWLITFALIADCVSGGTTVYSSPAYDPYTYCENYPYCYRRLGKRAYYDAFGDVFYASLALSIIEWLLFVATLVLLALAVHKHRRGNAPVGQTTTTAHETHDPKIMESGPAPTYEQQPAAPHAQPTYEQPAVQPMQQHPVQEQQPMH